MKLGKQFSQAADAMTCHTTPIMSGGLIGGMTHDPALCSGCRGRAALSAIERHVQDMEKALRKIDKLDGRYHDLNTARWMARKTLDASSPDGEG